MENAENTIPRARAPEQREVVKAASTSKAAKPKTGVRFRPESGSEETVTGEASYTSDSTGNSTGNSIKVGVAGVSSIDMSKEVAPVAPAADPPSKAERAIIAMEGAITNLSTILAALSEKVDSLSLEKTGGMAAPTAIAQHQIQSRPQPAPPAEARSRANTPVAFDATGVDPMEELNRKALETGRIRAAEMAAGISEADRIAAQEIEKWIYNSRTENISPFTGFMPSGEEGYFLYSPLYPVTDENRAEHLELCKNRVNTKAISSEVARVNFDDSQNGVVKRPQPGVLPSGGHGNAISVDTGNT